MCVWRAGWNPSWLAQRLQRYSRLRSIDLMLKKPGGTEGSEERKRLWRQGFIGKTILVTAHGLDWGVESWHETNPVAYGSLWGAQRFKKKYTFISSSNDPLIPNPSSHSVPHPEPTRPEATTWTDLGLSPMGRLTQQPATPSNIQTGYFGNSRCGSTQKIHICHWHVWEEKHHILGTGHIFPALESQFLIGHKVTLTHKCITLAINSTIA